MIAIVATAAAAAWVWQRRTLVRAAIPFAAFMAVQTLWNAAHAVEVCASTLQTAVFWDGMQTLPFVALGPLALLVAQACRGGRTLRWIALGVVVVLVPLAVAVITTPWHGALRADAHLNDGVLLYEFNRLDVAIAGIVYASLIVSGIAVLRDRRAQHGRYAAQTLALGCVLLVAPLADAFAMALELRFMGDRDISPFTTTAVALISVWALARHRLFDVSTVGREAVVDALAVPVIVLDEQTRVVDLNPAARDMLMKGAPFVPGESPQALFGSWTAALEMATCGQACRREIEGPTERFFAATYIPLVSGHGESIGGTLVLRDVTERRRAHDELERHVAARTHELADAVAALKQEISDREAAEKRLQQAQKMESIGRLAGGVAHDFNNVLTVIIGNAELAEPRAMDPEMAATLRSIIAAGRLATSITRQLLTFARRQPTTPQRLDLARSLAPAEHMLRRLLSENVILDMDLPRDLWPVRADATQLQQVLINLAVNARDAMPRGGRLRVSATNATIADGAGGSSPAGEYVRIAVADTGIGISEDIREHLFEPFFSTKGEGRGTGLGLAVVHGIVHQAGGYIDVDSTPGRGATIAVYLPRDRSADAAVAGPAGMELFKNDHDGVVVALVEDQDMVRAVVERVLERAHVPVHAFSSGRDLLRRLPELSPRPTLLLTDVVMPDANGFDLADSIAQVAPGMKAMFMTGHSEDVLGGALDGVEPGLLLTKPFGGRELLDRLSYIAHSAGPWVPRPRE